MSGCWRARGNAKVTIIMLIPQQHRSQIVESALQPINTSLESLTTSAAARHTTAEKDMIRILTLMAGIRTRALEHGWGEECDRDLGEAQTILQGIQKKTANASI